MSVPLHAPFWVTPLIFNALRLNSKDGCPLEHKFTHHTSSPLTMEIVGGYHQDKPDIVT